jgi:hypothetical protein
MTEINDSGAAKLYHALEKKMIEMAELMNNVNLKSLDISDPKDKSFDRIRILWDSAAKVAEASKSLGQTAGILKSEERPEEMKPFVDSIAVSRK